jgi:multiple sugar transport system substrate-binding protein
MEKTKTEDMATPTSQVETTSPPEVKPSAASPEVLPKKNGPSFLLVLVVLAVILLVAGGIWFMAGSKKEAGTQAALKDDSANVTKIVWAVHWADEAQRKGIFENGTLKVKGVEQYLDEYNKLHPNVKVELQVIPYNDYANKLKVLSDAGAPPDIYQTYSTWAVSYVQEGVLDKPPADIQEDVKNNYVSAAGPTINGEIWGIPTETNDYTLIYNKDLFRAAGIVDAKGEPDYPKTWSDLVTKALKLTKKDEKGNITQYGIAFLKGNDWQVVDPFLSLLFSDGGQYLSNDYKTAMFNSPAGVAVLNAELDLFKKGATDVNGNFYDFGTGKVAMGISPPWTKTKFKQNFGDKFATTVGVAPLPIFTKPATLQYSWFLGVTAKSTHKQEAWDFLRWLTSEVQPTGTTRYGDLMAENIGGIPARKVDFESHKDVLGDSYTKMFIDQMKYSIPEPNVFEASNIKAALMKEIEAAWAGQKTAKVALDDAATAVNTILSQYYK